MEAYWIWLSELENLSPRSKLRLLGTFGTPEAVYCASESALHGVEGLTDKDRLALNNRDLTKALCIQDSCREKNIRILTLDEPSYPDLLRQIPDPPIVLYYVGKIPDFDRSLSIALVGSRKASAQGLSIARKLGYELSAAGVIVVSGCADGADRAAMEGALRGGSPVVGVMGCGVDVVYPKACRRLLEDVRDFGCLISEYPPSTRPCSWHFPVRNRIISGLCRGVLVTEAPKRSGALITVRHAMEQGRDVFAVPGCAGMDACAGSNDLLRQGASLVERGNDVTEGYEYLFPGRIRRLDEAESLDFLYDFPELSEDGNERIAASSVTIPQTCDKKDVDKSENQTYIDVHGAAADLAPEEAAVLNTLFDGPHRADEIIRSCGLTTPKVISLLTMLQLRGLIESLPGGSYALKENH